MRVSEPLDGGTCGVIEQDGQTIKAELIERVTGLSPSE
jgi:hypothetical protein